MRPIATLRPLNCQLKIAGVDFFAHQVKIDLDSKTIVVEDKTFGTLTIRESDDIEMDYQDLDVPAYIRAMQVRQGWETMTPKQLFALTLALEGRR